MLETRAHTGLIALAFRRLGAPRPASSSGHGPFHVQRPRFNIRATRSSRRCTSFSMAPGQAPARAKVIPRRHRDLHGLVARGSRPDKTGLPGRSPEASGSAGRGFDTPVQESLIVEALRSN